MLYFAEKLSPNMARSAEGYLICRNVPVARVGVQEYLTGELRLFPPPGAGAPAAGGGFLPRLHRLL